MMKKNLLYLLMAVFTLSFVACSDDDDPLIPAKELNTTFGASEEATLNLKYGNDPVIGKQVKFKTENNKTATLTLVDIIPGQSETVINNIQLIEGETEYTFNGSSAMTKAVAAAGSIAYSGSIKKGELNLSLNVTMPDPRGWSKMYSLGDYTLGTIGDMENMVVSSALHSNWTANDQWCDTIFPMLARTIGGVVLPQVLKSVTLESDGNISAEYSSGSLQLDPSVIMGLMFGGPAPSEDYVKGLIPASGWLTSPKNLAYWFEKDGKLYVKLNIPTIIAQSMSDSQTEGNEALANIINTVLNGNVTTIKSLLSQFTQLDFSQISDASFEMLLSWIKNGIPLNVKSADNGHTFIYLDKIAFDPIFTDNELPKDSDDFGTKSDLVKLWALLSDAGIIPEDAKIAILLLSPLPANWPSTTDFELGLNLK